MTKKKKKKIPLVVRFKKWVLETLLDSFSLFFALIIEIAVMSISMIIISPGGIVTAALVGNGLIIVLFGARAWMRGKYWYNYLVWGSFAFIAIFFNISYGLASIQSESTVSAIVVTEDNDPLLKTIRENIASAENDLLITNDDFNESFRGETVDRVGNDRTALRNKITQYENEEIERLETILSGAATARARSIHSDITAETLLQAIPNTLKDGKIIEFLLFFLMAVGLEFTIVSNVQESKSIKKDEDKEILPDKPLKEPDDSITEDYPIDSDLTKYAYGRFRNVEPGSPLNPRLYTLRKSGISIDTFIKITKLALIKKIIYISRPGNETFPADGINEQVFTERMKE